MIETRERRHLPLVGDLGLIEADHFLLRERCLRLDASLNGLARRPVEGDDTSAALGEQDVHAELYEFRQLLFDHLANEEQGGLIELAVAEAPRLARRLEGLRQEHRSLRHRMETLLAKVSRTSWLGIHAEFVAFRDELRDHERAEDDLMQHAYLDDLGGRG